MEEKWNGIYEITLQLTLCLQTLVLWPISMRNWTLLIIIIIINGGVDLTRNNNENPITAFDIFHHINTNLSYYLQLSNALRYHESDSIIMICMWKWFWWTCIFFSAKMLQTNNVRCNFGLGAKVQRSHKRFLCVTELYDA